jgi:hypothetical protein
MKKTAWRRGRNLGGDLWNVRYGAACVEAKLTNSRADEYQVIA